MNKYSTLFFSLLFFASNQAQTNAWQIVPEAGPSFSLGHLNEDYGFGNKVGLDAGIHVDKVWKWFGIGAYGGYQQLGVNPILPQDAGLTDPSLAFNVRNYINGKDNTMKWREALIGFGPLLNLPFSDKFSLQVYSKPGAAWTKAPKYSTTVNYTEPIDQEFTLYELSPDAYPDEKNWHFMLNSGIRLQYRITKNFGLNLSTHHIFIPKNTYIVSHLSTTFEGENYTDEEVLENLQNASTRVEEIRCNIQSISVTAGLALFFGSEREHTNDLSKDYTCEMLQYTQPEYNDPVVLERNASQKFIWKDFNDQNHKTLSYKLIFYQKLEDGSFEELSVFETNKNSLVVNFEDLVSDKKQIIYWEVDTYLNQEKQCLFSSQKMRLQVFETKKIAQENLPVCNE